MAKIVCPQCTARFSLPLSGKKEVTCPKCRAKFSPLDPDAAPETAPPPRPSKKTARKAAGEVFLSTCPICGAGKVIKDRDGDEERFVCTKCSSVMEQTIYGYSYIRIDPEFEDEKGDLLNEPITKDDLDLMVQEAGGSADADKTDFAGSPAVALDRVAEILGQTEDAEEKDVEEEEEEEDEEDEEEEPSKPEKKPRRKPAAGSGSLLDDILAEETAPKKKKPAKASKRAKAGLLDDILAEEKGAPSKPSRAKPKKRQKVLMWEIDEERLRRRRRKRRAEASSSALARAAAEASDAGGSSAAETAAPLEASDEALAVATAPEAEAESSSELAAAVGSSAQMAAASSDEAAAASSGEASAAAAAPANASSSAAAASVAAPTPIGLPAVAAMLAIALAALSAARAFDAFYSVLAERGALSAAAVKAAGAEWRQAASQQGAAAASRAWAAKRRDAADRALLFLIALILAVRLARGAAALDYVCRVSPASAGRSSAGAAVNAALLIAYAAGVYLTARECGSKTIAAAPALLLYTLLVSAVWMAHTRLLAPRAERKRMASLLVWMVSNLLFAGVVYLCIRGVDAGGWSLHQHYNAAEAAALAVWLNAVVNWQFASGRFDGEKGGARWPVTLVGLLLGAAAGMALYA